MVKTPQLRQPPASVEAEMSLVGSVLLDPKVLVDVQGVIDGHEFTDSACAHVYAATLAVWRRTGEIDLVMLQDELRRRGAYSDVEGEAFVTPGKLVNFANAVPSAANAIHYAKVVADNAFRRGFIAACDDASWQMHGAESPAATMSDLMGKLSVLTARGKRTGTTTMTEALDRYLAELEAEVEPVIRTGISAFDHVFGGIPSRGVVCVIGLPGSGKSSLVNNLVCELAFRRSRRGRVHSYEMGERASVTMAASESGVPLLERQILGVKLTKHEYIKLLEVRDRAEAEYVNFSTGHMAARDIYTMAAADHRNGISFTVIDYIQNLPRSERMTEAESIGETCRYAQRISREFDQLVMVVSQMTLASKREKRPPLASDCVGGGSIQDTADMVIGVYRPCLWENPNDYQGDWAQRKQHVELHVLKNKFGKVGAVDATFKGEVFKFTDAPYISNTGIPV